MRNGKQTYKKAEVPTFPSVVDFLNKTITLPGELSECYSKGGRTLSPLNSMLVALQCAVAGIEIGPSATFGDWKILKRNVKKGERAFYVCKPCPHTRTEEKDGEEREVHWTGFTYIKSRFVLSQTEGEPYEPPDPRFDIGEAIIKLEVEPVPFTMDNLGCMGYAMGRTFAVNPLGTHQLATTLHEMAHIVLGHTEGTGYFDNEDRTPRSMKELEAEGTAMLVLDMMGEPDQKEARGYMQNWNIDGLTEIPEKNARHIFSAAYEIMKAGATYV